MQANQFLSGLDSFNVPIGMSAIAAVFISQPRCAHATLKPQYLGGHPRSQLLVDVASRTNASERQVFLWVVVDS